jgi:ABC-type Fe3+-hydroxamate transport system substrate-binding protein
MGRKVTFPYPPKRIVSLVPSQTEFLIDIGAPVVGRTKFCIHPKEKVGDIAVVGGTKKVLFEKIKELNPDLVVGNKEENYKEEIEELAEEYPVWMSDVFTLDDAFEMMVSLGKITGKVGDAERMRQICLEALSTVKGRYQGKVLYLIWRNPWMAAGKHTFIDHMLGFLGYENRVSDERYPELTTEEIKTLRPDKILLSSEPYPFKAKHIHELNEMLPDLSYELVDGELFSWYGSRLSHWE